VEASKYDRYRAKAISHQFAESVKKKTPFVSVIYEVTDGPGTSKQFEWQGYFSEATHERTVESLRRSGCTFPGDDVTNLSGLGSKEVEIQVEQTDYGPRVAWVNEPRVSSVNEDQKLDKNAKASLAARLKGTLISMRAGGAPAPKKTSAADAASAFAANDDGAEPAKATGTDDIPF